MTTRRFAIVTFWACALLALAGAFSLQAQASGANPLLADDVVKSYEIAIEPATAPQMITFETQDLGTEPVPQPTLIVDPTPIAPPAWIQIPDDLIATPTPVSSASTPLPMLTNITSAPRDGSAVYLTFDDGPHPTYTIQILDLLARYNAKATFFVLGEAVERNPQIVQRIVAEGHSLGNHTYFHEALPRETDDVVVQTLSATNNAIARATGRTSTCMRPPYGSLDDRTLQIVRNQGYSVSMWEVDSSDWKYSDAYTIAAGVLRDTNLGNRVLFHDGPSNRAATVAALESVLSVLSQRGVTFAALPCS